MKMKTLMMAAATTAFMAVSSVAFASPVVHPATDWTGQGTWPPVTATPNDFDDSAAQDKATFGDLGEQSVVDAMNTDAWFGTIAGFTLSVSDLIASSGDCGTGNVTCDSSASWTGDTGEAANLIVIHTGRGSSGTQGGNTAVDTIFAFFFYDAISSFTLDGIFGGGSWLRAYTVDCDECGGGGNTPVPVPGALPLLATGLAGLGYIARRRRKA